MKIVTLSQNFYKRYSSCKEILKKENRPYLMVLITVENQTFAIPFRSHIRHKYVYWTDENNLCGLDFTKAVLLSSEDDIASKNVQIRQHEFDVIKGQEYIITKKFTTFLRTYKKAYARMDVERNRILVQNSALQYFLNDILK